MTLSGCRWLCSAVHFARRRPVVAGHMHLSKTRLGFRVGKRTSKAPSPVRFVNGGCENTGCSRRSASCFLWRGRLGTSRQSESSEAQGTMTSPPRFPSRARATTAGVVMLGHDGVGDHSGPLHGELRIRLWARERVNVGRLGSQSSPPCLASQFQCSTMNLGGVHGGCRAGSCSTSNGGCGCRW